MDELTLSAFKIYKVNNHISPTLICRKLKISHAKAYSVCCEIWQHEALKRFKKRTSKI